MLRNTTEAAEFTYRKGRTRRKQARNLGDSLIPSTKIPKRHHCSDSTAKRCSKIQNDGQSRKGHDATYPIQSLTTISQQGPSAVVVPRIPFPSLACCGSVSFPEL